MSMYDEYKEEALKFLCLKAAGEMVTDYREMEEWMMDQELNLFDIRIEYQGESTTLERAMLMQLAHHSGLRELRESVVQWISECPEFRARVERRLEDYKL